MKNRAVCALNPPPHTHTLTVPCVFCLFKATVRLNISTKAPHTPISPPTREVRPSQWTRDHLQTTATPPRSSILIRMHMCERRIPPYRRYSQSKTIALSLQHHFFLVASLRIRFWYIYMFFHCNKMYHSLLSFPIIVFFFFFIWNITGLKLTSPDFKYFSCSFFQTSFCVTVFCKTFLLLVVLLTASNQHMLLICNDNI